MIALDWYKDPFVRETFQIKGSHQIPLSRIEETELGISPDLDPTHLQTPKPINVTASEIVIEVDVLYPQNSFLNTTLRCCEWCSY